MVNQIKKKLKIIFIEFCVVVVLVILVFTLSSVLNVLASEDWETVSDYIVKEQLDSFIYDSKYKHIPYFCQGFFCYRVDEYVTPDNSIGYILYTWDFSDSNKDWLNIENFGEEDERGLGWIILDDTTKISATSTL